MVRLTGFVSSPKSQPAAPCCLLRLALMSATQATRAKILEGRPIADQIKNEVSNELRRLRAEYGFQPCLAAVLVGNDDASTVYVRNKVRTCAEVGLRSEQFNLAESTTTDELLLLVEDLNKRDDIDGILVQLPLPKQIEEAAVI